jgi:hypothetical protein
MFRLPCSTLTSWQPFDWVSTDLKFVFRTKIYFNLALRLESYINLVGLANHEKPILENSMKRRYQIQICEGCAVSQWIKQPPISMNHVRMKQVPLTLVLFSYPILIPNIRKVYLENWILAMVTFTIITCCPQLYVNSTRHMSWPYTLRNSELISYGRDDLFGH